MHLILIYLVQPFEFIWWLSDFIGGEKGGGTSCFIFWGETYHYHDNNIYYYYVYNLLLPPRENLKGAFELMGERASYGTNRLYDYVTTTATGIFKKMEKTVLLLCWLDGWCHGKGWMEGGM